MEKNIANYTEEIINFLRNLKIVEISEKLRFSIEREIKKSYEEGGEELVLAKKEEFLKKCQIKALKMKIAKLRAEVKTYDKDIAVLDRELIDLSLKKLIFDFQNSGAEVQDFVNGLQNLSFSLFREQSKKIVNDDFSDEELEEFVDATDAFKVEVIEEELEKKERDLRAYKLILDFICKRGYDVRASYDKGYQLAFLNGLRYGYKGNEPIDFEHLEEVFRLSLSNRDF